MSTKIVDIKPKATPEILAFKDAAEAVGINPRIVDALMKRLSLSINQNKRYSPKETVDQIDSKIAMALDCMDDFTFANANLKELGIFTGIMIEKGQLLKGLPTQIMSVEERKNLHELLPLMMREAQRRGITIDMESVREKVTVLPASDKITS